VVPGEDNTIELEESLPPTQFHQFLHAKATPHMDRLKKDPYNADAAFEINKLNAMIEQENEKKGTSTSHGFIQHWIHTSHYKVAEDYESLIKEVPTICTDSDPKVVKKTEQRNEKLVADQKLAAAILPRLRPELDKFNVTKGYPRTWNFDGPEFPALRKSPENPAVATPGKQAAATAVTKWQPGYTLDGDKILGKRPFERWNNYENKMIMTGHSFIVEKLGELNPIEVVPGHVLGNRATAGYLGLADEDQYDIRASDKTYTRDDAANFGSIKGFSSNPATGSSFPPGYALVVFKSGKEDILSRTAVRKILGKADGDWEIRNFFDERGLTPTWEAEPEPIKMLEGSRGYRQIRGGKAPKGRTNTRRGVNRVAKDDSILSDTASEDLFLDEMEGIETGGKNERRGVGLSHRGDKRGLTIQQESNGELEALKAQIAKLTEAMEWLVMRREEEEL
jgi:hypothetical protein